MTDNLLATSALSDPEIETRIDTGALRKAFGLFPTGVCVAGAVLDDGLRIGVTVNSFSSVSLDPPQILICLAKSLRSHDSFLKTRGFAVSVLSLEQTHLSNHFASRSVTAKWDGIDVIEGREGGLILDPHLAHFDCRTEQSFVSGDHTILIGRVLDFGTSQERSPLVYFRGDYDAVSSSQHAGRAQPASRQGS